MHDMPLSENVTSEAEAKAKAFQRNLVLAGVHWKLSGKFYEI
jgi:hypothetical protein